MVTQVTTAPKSTQGTAKPVGSAVPVSGRQSRFRALLARTDGAVKLNVGLILLLAVWVAGELIIEGTAYTLVAIVPAVPFFAGAAYNVSTGGSAAHWLRASGVICALLGLLCAVSFVDSLAMTPVDVSCAITSALFGGVFVFGACYQLLRGARDS
jgi:hypothetical protein